MSKHKSIKPGIYKHYKGNEYNVLGEAQFTESDNKVVVYHDQKADKFWARPKDNFATEVEVDGKKKERFEFISEAQDEYKDKYLRLLAENQNLLKQTAREKDEFRQFAQMRLIEQILPVYDNLKISLVHVGEEKSSWVQGVEYVVKQFADILKQFGVEEVITKDQAFDHNTMEAVSEEETGDKKLDGKVAKEVTAGYLLGGKVIKPARVTVYKAKAA